MQEPIPTSELLDRYIQADLSTSSAQFPGFLAELKKLRQEGQAPTARTWAGRAVHPNMDYSSLLQLWGFLREKDQAAAANGALRVAILGGPTTQQLRQLIELFLAAEGIAAEVYESEYGLFRQEILTAGSGLDEFKPQVVFIATSWRDVSRWPAVDAGEDAVDRLAGSEIEQWVHLWQTCQSRWNAVVIQNNFEISPTSAMGHYSLRAPGSAENYLERLNHQMSRQAPRHVVLHDLRRLAAEAGARQWFDPRFYLEFKMPCGPECLASYAYSVVSLVRAIRGKSRKVLVLDLDNTLWGGVIGDLGPGGIRFGQGSGEGEAYLAFQQHLKELSARGILLAVCSKNDAANAREPFEKRPDMVLKLGDFASFVANWNNKPDNLRAIAEQLELKLDSFVFVDDNPAERAIVRRTLPQVAVPDMPEDPAGYIAALAVGRYFETITFTREDAARSAYYADNAKRQELASRSTDTVSFLKSLSMRMIVQPVADINIERATQLVNKSNQFNLTTRRHTVAQMREMAQSGQWRTFTFSLRDAFGDNGLISVILASIDHQAFVIQDWVMSCRVLQRGVEQFTRQELVTMARSCGCKMIRGSYIPTAKNGLVKNLLADLGFAAAGNDGATTFWSLAVDVEPTPLPHFIEKELGP